MSAAPKVTHWMDDRGLVVTDAFLQSDRATSDWRAAYTIPCRKTRAGTKPIASPAAAEPDDCQPCRDCADLAVDGVCPNSGRRCGA